MNKQHGFSVVELGLVCGVVLIVGVLGYVFYNRAINGVEPVETAQIDTAEVPTIRTTDDLAKAETMLDDTNLEDDTTLSSLDAELATFE